MPLTRALLRDAVALRTEADVPVGCYLSGGLDSSAVLGFATEATRKPVTAFTVAFDHPAYDEAPKAAEAARHVGASFNPIGVNGEDFAEHFSDAVWHSEMIHFNAHGVARYLLSRAVQQSGYRAVLAGEGADELFAGYAFSAIPVISKSNRAFRMALALLAMASRPRRRSARILSSLATTAVRCLGMFGRRRRIPEMLTARARVLHRLLSPDFVREFGNWDPGSVLLGPVVERDEWQRADPVKLALNQWIKFVLANYHLAAERLDMAHGVEVRLPFLDHPLFEAVQAFPLALLRKNGQRKYLLREASRSVVTDSVYRGRKQPFLAPPPSLRNDGLHTLIQDVLRSSQMKAVRFFDGSAVRRLLESLPKMTPQARTAYDPFLLMMTSISILQERYGM